MKVEKRMSSSSSTADPDASAKHSRPTYIRDPSRPRSGKDIRQISSCQVRYSKSCRRISLSRLIVGKLLFTPRNVTLSELIILYDNQLNLERLAKKDPGFRHKFGSSLEELSQILSQTQVSLGYPQRAINGLHQKLKGMEAFALPKRNLANLQKRAHDWVWLEVSTPNGIEKCRVPPKKVIAKGYTDKGSARNLAEDGSPTWQELATADLDYLQALRRLSEIMRLKK